MAIFPDNLWSKHPEASLKQLLCMLFLQATLTSNAKLKLTKNQANAKQHPEADLSVFGNY